MDRRTLLKAAPAAMAAAALPRTASAAEVTLRLHQFLPPVATIPKAILKPWADSVSAASGGRIEIQHFDAMALGGRPPELMDQARDGVADITMTVVGYTPGRFPRSEVFELPFMMSDTVATGSAYWEMVETDFQQNEFKDVKVLGAFVHGPGVIHTKDPVEGLADMKGQTLRGPTRVITALLEELGATPVGMPLPAIPEALSKGVISGTVIPWEVTPAVRLSELVTNHLEFGSKEALYTATFVIAMNKAKYESLPDDLRQVLDAESGAKLSTMASTRMLEGDAPGRAIAEKAGNAIRQVSAADAEAWKAKAEPVIARWVEEMQGKGIDGQALIDQARALIAKHSA